MPLVGDGVTDDRAALQDFIDACPPGGYVETPPEMVFRVVIDYSTPDRGLILKPNSTLLLNGSRINYELHGDVYGTRFKSGSKIRNGSVNVTVSDGLSSLQGIYHAPLALGAAYSEVLDINNRGPFLEAAGWGIHNLEVSTVKPNGLHISGVGGIRDGYISDIVGLDNSNAFGLVNFDWGSVGPTGTVPQNRANFNNSNGTFCTVHPTNIKIERIRAGVFSNPISEVIRLSGCSGIDVSNVFVKSCGASSFSHYGGDFGYEFCKYGAERYQAFMNTSLRGMNALSCGKYGIRVDCYADNIASEPGYIPLTNPIYPTNLLIDGIAVGVGAGNVTHPALKIGAMAGGIITRVRGNFFHIGADFAGGLSRLQWTDSVMHGGDSTAISYTGAGASGASINRVVFEN